MKIFGYGCGIVMLCVLSFIWSGYVLSVLWSWFIVTTFQLPSISIPVAIGIMSMIGLLKSNTSNTKEINTEEFGKVFSKACGMAALIPFFALVIGWIAHSFM